MKRFQLPLITSLVLSFILFAVIAGAQEQSFRHGMFFHLSTGANIWGPNGSTTSIPLEIAHYNLQHDLEGADSVSLNETWFPVNYDNEWATWHTIFEENYPEGICTYCMTNPIIVVKSCFPSSNIDSWGIPIDTLTPTIKTVYNYKWHWRHIIGVMATHPEHFFMIWTNAPQVQSQTNPNQAMLSNKFCTWAKDTLAAGLDPVFGEFPPNVHVFDFFHKLTLPSGYMNPIYAVNTGDSHPNAAATQLVAPQFVEELFDHSLAYETTLSLKDITGTITYDNSIQSPMVNLKVYLKVGCCTIADSTLTDNMGYYSFPNLQPGNYTIQPVKTNNWGGVNSDDAMLILKHFVGLVQLTGLKQTAGYIDNNHYINTNDALMVARRYIGQLMNFPTSDWVFETGQLVFTGANDVTLNLKTLCRGDVNGSYFP